MKGGKGCKKMMMCMMMCGKMAMMGKYGNKKNLYFLNVIDD